ncbi:MAG: UxaA family hydrolase, partial [Lachnospiraceae bacterium]|nr:UxaA family hydrolase [Lachnospiraceae bacterium]
MEWLKIHADDNVEVSAKTGHKRAIRDIKAGEAVIKYGFSIGNATEDIKAGDHVHSHNLKTGLKEGNVYTYEPNLTELKFGNVKDATFEGYLRENGDVGIRNEIWIVNTVGCVNALAERLSILTGAKCFPHPYGCSQLGDDHTTTQKILKGLVNHPNAAGVLVLALGCENNTLDSFKALLGDINEKRVKFLVVQKCEDEIEEGVKLIKELEAYRDTFKKQTFPVSKLRVGLKCGGSDGFSGITANPLLGQFSDRLISAGGGTVLTEVP